MVCGVGWGEVRCCGVWGGVGWGEVLWCVGWGEVR